VQTVSIKSTPKRSFAFRFYRAVGLIGFIPFIIFTVDTLLTPMVPHPIYNNVPVRLAQSLIFAPTAVVLGFLCVRRARENIIGWLLIVLGYGLYGDSLRADFGGVTFRAMFGAIAIAYFWFTNLLILCYFPDGRIYPPRFERIGGLFAAFMCLLPLMSIITQPGFGLALSSEITTELGTGRIETINPFHIPALAFFDVNRLGAPIIFITFFYGVGTLILHYRRGDTMQRLQIRWLLLIAVLMFALAALPIPIVGLASTFGFGFVFPAAIAYAILRHRLYDIDIIIRRTLIYAVLTTILAAIYFGGIVLTQQIFRAAAGETSDLAVVVSTLLIAALFTPIRRRVQDTIDRRLYRRKYDVEQTLATFQRNLRDDVDIETLKANLIKVVSETMQPATIALWMKETSSTEANLRSLNAP
jgi:hypothetical protein